MNYLQQQIRAALRNTPPETIERAEELYLVVDTKIVIKSAYVSCVQAHKSSSLVSIPLRHEDSLECIETALIKTVFDKLTQT